MSTNLAGLTLITTTAVLLFTSLSASGCHESQGPAQGPEVAQSTAEAEYRRRAFENIRASSQPHGEVLVSFARHLTPSELERVSRSAGMESVTELGFRVSRANEYETSLPVEWQPKHGHVAELIAVRLRRDADWLVNGGVNPSIRPKLLSAASEPEKAARIWFIRGRADRERLVGYWKKIQT